MTPAATTPATSGAGPCDCQLVSDHQGDKPQSAGTDFIGIHVQTRHDYISGFFSGGNDLGETTILRLEPDEE